MANDHIFALIDCNNFYASCERVFNPSLNNKPVVILSNNDGCVIARSQEAKDLGIEMATPAYKNKALFTKHNVNIFSSNYTLYGDLSARVMDVISNFSPDIEIYSIDESFIELSGFKNRDLTEYGREIKATVEKWTGIPVSVGIAKTKTLAKIANHIAKKKKYYKGVFNLLDIEDINQVLVQVPVSKIWGIGRQYSHFLNKNNIVTALDLIQANDEWISKYLTSLGHQTVLELKGTSCIDMNSIDPPKKGIVSSKSFGKAVNTLSELEEAVSTYINIACNKLRKQHSVAQYISVYISTNRFKDTPQYNNNASIRFLSPTAYTPDFIQAALVILKRIYRKGFYYKKASVMITEISQEENMPYEIFQQVYPDTVKKDIMTVVDKLNSKFGTNTIFYGAQGTNNNWKMRRELLSPSYTTSWRELPRIK